MNETTITTVAAQPGWFIATIHCVDDADRGVLALDPIVAWEISRSASIEPSPGCPGELEIWREVTPIAFGNNDFSTSAGRSKRPTENSILRATAPLTTKPPRWIAFGRTTTRGDIHQCGFPAVRRGKRVRAVNHDHALERELTAIGLHVSHTETAEPAQLETAAEFERALLDGGWVSSRNAAHQVLLLLKRRAVRAQGEDAS
jgi:hypothetical protein